MRPERNETKKNLLQMSTTLKMKSKIAQERQLIADEIRLGHPSIGSAEYDGLSHIPQDYHLLWYPMLTRGAHSLLAPTHGNPVHCMTPQTGTDGHPQTASALFNHSMGCDWDTEFDHTHERQFR